MLIQKEANVVNRAVLIQKEANVVNRASKTLPGAQEKWEVC